MLLEKVHLIQGRCCISFIALSLFHEKKKEKKKKKDILSSLNIILKMEHHTV